MKLLLMIGMCFLVFPVFAVRTMQGPPFPWHDWYMIAYGGPSSFHEKAFDLHIQNVSSVQQTLKVTCEFTNLVHQIGNWNAAPAEPFTALQTATMSNNAANLGSNKFEVASLVIQPNEVIKLTCSVMYASQQHMQEFYRDDHQKGILINSIEISEDRGAIVVFVNSRTENYGTPPPKMDKDGAVIEPMLRNISKTFFYNGGRAF